ncbi:uncharacterized protein LOC128091994 isoform X2 [Tympanuchus pallidicinctus]|uniref:uncharacterized protein LOC128091994 isoform X2 n=1 Tax=Tympanuchus pallidicinctus TaxID=109042 RepID=UPI002286E5A2|nr:uncharacterized protein LOC128091994 isoform X2 [Tympanuchus pallidicinctus]
MTIFDDSGRTPRLKSCGLKDRRSQRAHRVILRELCPDLAAGFLKYGFSNVCFSPVIIPACSSAENGCSGSISGARDLCRGGRVFQQGGVGAAGPCAASAVPGRDAGDVRVRGLAGPETCIDLHAGRRGRPLDPRCTWLEGHGRRPQPR